MGRDDDQDDGQIMSDQGERRRQPKLPHQVAHRSSSRGKRYGENDRVDLLSDVDDNSSEESSDGMQTDTDSNRRGMNMARVPGGTAPATHMGVVTSIPSMTSGEIEEKLLVNLMQDSVEATGRAPPAGIIGAQQQHKLLVTMPPTSTIGSPVDPRAALRPPPLVLLDNTSSRLSTTTTSAMGVSVNSSGSPLSLVDGLSVTLTVPPNAAELYRSMQQPPSSTAATTVVENKLPKEVDTTSSLSLLSARKVNSAVAPLREELQSIQQRMLMRTGPK